jgi:dipeptide/tripeptide permease
MHNLHQRAALLLAVLSIGATGLLASNASAFEGEFCSGVHLPEGGAKSCVSNEVSKIRRTIGDSDSGFTTVYVTTNIGRLVGECFFAGCSANTGYLSADGKGKGRIEDSVPAANRFFGFLYE